MARFSKKQIEEALDVKAEHLTREDITRVVDNAAAVNQLIDKFPVEGSLPRVQAAVLFELLQAESAGRMRIPLDALKQAAAALIYLGAPFDLVPDDAADGLSDDAAVLDVAVHRVEKYVKALCEADGRDPSDYLE